MLSASPSAVISFILLIIAALGVGSYGRPSERLSEPHGAAKFGNYTKNLELYGFLGRTFVCLASPPCRGGRVECWAPHQPSVVYSTPLADALMLQVEQTSREITSEVILCRMGQFLDFGANFAVRHIGRDIRPPAPQAKRSRNVAITKKYYNKMSTKANTHGAHGRWGISVFDIGRQAILVILPILSRRENIVSISKLRRIPKMTRGVSMKRLTVGPGLQERIGRLFFLGWKVSLYWVL